MNSISQSSSPIIAGGKITPQQPTTAREAFDKFVGETFYSQMVKSLRATTDKPAYFHGGRAEEVFQGQLDQVIVEKLTAANAHSFSGPMFDLFSLRR